MDYIITFIYIAHSMTALLYETVPAFEDTWIESSLGGLGRYRMAVEEDIIRDRRFGPPSPASGTYPLLRRLPRPGGPPPLSRALINRNKPKGKPQAKSSRTAAEPSQAKLARFTGCDRIGFKAGATCNDGTANYGPPPRPHSHVPRFVTKQCTLPS